MNKICLFLKRLRLEHGELLFDMAKRLQVSSAFLSAVENGRKSAPAVWQEILCREYNLSEQQKRELAEAIDDSVKHIRMDVSSVDSRKRSCALAFARNFEEFTDDDIRKIMKIMNRRED